MSIKLIISSPYSKFSNSIGNRIPSTKTRLGNNILEKRIISSKENVNDNEIKLNISNYYIVLYLERWQEVYLLLLSTRRVFRVKTI